MSNKPKQISMDELTREMAPVRKSREGYPLPKDPDWWFPSYVPAWARMQSREMYGILHSALSTSWQIAEVLRRTKAPVGRPRKTTDEDDERFLLDVEACKAALRSTGRRATDVAALRIVMAKEHVEAERVRYHRLRKARVQKSAK
jgi:hypothetical protein